MKVKTVTIIGGGSSGWMAAAALAKLCPNIELTVVESPDIKTVGVGESTLGHITKFLDLLGLEDKDWMAECNATYKNSIRFTNFRENDGSSFQYPFSLGFDYTDKPTGINTWSELAAVYPDEFPPETFAEFYATANTFIANKNKQTKNTNRQLRHFNFKWDTAYHVDAQLFGQYLKDKIAIPHGTKHIFGEVASYSKTDKGYIDKIFLMDGTALESDLWIDCTGFKSMILEGWMGSKFVSFDTHLFNDSAWACRIPYEDRETEMHNFTDCHALGNGWVWHIPLWNRIGTGYVYSSKFTSKEAAKQEFINHLASTGSKERAESAEMFHVDMRHGHRENAWVKNVVGVGLSYGFVEPLESTGLLTTHENITKLVEVLNRRNGFVSNTEREGFNFAVENEVIKFRDFVSQHYALSMRDDTPYWEYCTEYHNYCPDLRSEYRLANAQYYTLIGNITLNRTYDPGFVAGLFIAAGMGVKPISTKEIALHTGGSGIGIMTRIEELDYAKRRFEEYREYVSDVVDKLPSHYEFLKNEIYDGKDDYAL
jgi:tryptophan halogenase